MLGILGITLKIIMWILIVLISLILVLIGILLIVPIRYELQGSKCVSTKINGQVSFLFKLFRGNFIYEKKQLYYIVKVLFFTVAKEEVEKEEPIKKTEKEKPLSSKTKEINEVSKQAKEIKEISKPKEVKVVKEIKKEKKAEKKIKNKKIKRVKKSKDPDKVSVLDQVKSWYSFLKKEENKGLIKFVFKQIKKILSSILPRSFDGYANIGFDDPASTGATLAVVSMLYPLYKEHFTLTPDFDGERLEGYGQVKGRIIIGVIVYYGLRLIIDSRVRRLIKEARK